MLEEKKRPPRILPEGFKWIQAVSVSEEVHRLFAARCARNGLDRLQVMRALVELYAHNDFPQVDDLAQRR